MILLQLVNKRFLLLLNSFQNNFILEYLVRYLACKFINCKIINMETILFRNILLLR